jgi:formylglycine-generating enzyme required for sulfatase activity
MDWYYTNTIKKIGPLSSMAIIELRTAGLLNDETWVHSEDSQVWMTYSKAFEQLSLTAKKSPVSGPTVRVVNETFRPIPAPQSISSEASPALIIVVEETPLENSNSPQSKMRREKSQKRKEMHKAALIASLMVIVAFISVSLSSRVRVNDKASKLANLFRATSNEPYVNDLGMKFVSVPLDDNPNGKKVLFSIWETSVSDFAKFVDDSGYRYELGSNPIIMENGKQVQKAVAGWKEPGFSQNDQHPVTCVSWEDALAFCKWITEKERASGTIPSNAEYRLPTDAEWSSAVGIGELEQKQGFNTPDKFGDKNETSGIYPFGAWPPPNRVGNFGDTSMRNSLGGNVGWLNSAGDFYEDGFSFTSPAGTYPSNLLGLFDLEGNVQEWCMDSYDSETKYRTLRGGSWNEIFNSGLRSNWRSPEEPDNRLTNIGFRCVLAERK